MDSPDDKDPGKVKAPFSDSEKRKGKAPVFGALLERQMRLIHNLIRADSDFEPSTPSTPSVNSKARQAIRSTAMLSERSAESGTAAYDKKEKGKRVEGWELNKKLNFDVEADTNEEKKTGGTQVKGDRLCREEKVWMPIERTLISAQTWADSPRIKTLRYEIPGRKPDDLKRLVFLIRARLHDEVDGERRMLKGMLITRKETQLSGGDCRLWNDEDWGSFLRIDFISSKNDVTLLLVKHDGYIAALKTMGKWRVFRIKKGDVSKIPAIPLSAELPFTESYPSILGKTTVKEHELLQFDENTLERAVNSLVSGPHTPEFAEATSKLITFACEMARSNRILAEILSSLIVPRLFGLLNEARVHLWSFFSRIYFFSVSEGDMKKAVEAKFTKEEIHKFISIVRREVGILKRPTAHQQSSYAVEQFLSDFKREAETPNTDLWKILSVY